jgi:tRNA(Arg) A34 adenosine deaminase TadA
MAVSPHQQQQSSQADDDKWMQLALQDVRHNHRVEVTDGVMAETSAAMLREFFRARR